MKKYGARKSRDTLPLRNNCEEVGHKVFSLDPKNHYVLIHTVQYIVVMNEIETNCTKVLIFLKMQLYQGLNNCREEAWRKMQKYQVQLRIGSLLI